MKKNKIPSARQWTERVPRNRQGRRWPGPLAGALPLLFLAPLVLTDQEAMGQTSFRMPTVRSAPTFRSTPSISSRMSQPTTRMRANTTRMNDWSSRTSVRANQAQQRTLQSGQRMRQQAEQRYEPERIQRDSQLRHLGNSTSPWVAGSSPAEGFRRADPSVDSWSHANEASRPGRYGVVTIYNPTEREINYSVRWGEGRAWEFHSVRAHGWRWHSWSYRYSHSDRFPTPYICFDATFTEDHPEKEYALETYAATEPGPDVGRPYHFVIEDDGVHIDLEQGQEPACAPAIPIAPY